ncbi:RNA polymerase sigma factor FliA [Neobacillus rhizosphaerae]|uniref:RNA polymerase sigma factor FliA n=1 Tax=Neobacillus rhizosphaerae TaxID=2880965 RepID=A0ABM9EVX8_9BACI|nr:RNA polymerase sigma factor FliA [Neobacillus rhizosphaerae]
MKLFFRCMLELPRNNRKRATKKDWQVENFEQLATQYEPMIHKIIHSLNIYHNQEEFYQTGLIGLWEASNRFNAEKGKFSNYAYSYIKGKILTELSTATKQKDKSIYPKEEYWDTIEDQGSHQPLEIELLLSYCQGLTEKETKWVLASCLQFLSIREIAEQEQVSISAVKQWRNGARKKLHGLIIK